MRRTLRTARDALAYGRLFAHDPERAPLIARPISGQAHLLDAAKRLHAAVYLAKGFIPPTAVEDGIQRTVADPHQLHADYFATTCKDRVLAVARQIRFRGDGSHDDSFPVLTGAVIHGHERVRIQRVDPTRVVEISALVRAPHAGPAAPLLLYRAMWQHSVRSEHELWVMACDVRLRERLGVLFGPGVTTIGRRTPYPGGDVVPAAIDIPASHAYVRRLARTAIPAVRRAAARFMLSRAA